MQSLLTVDIRLENDVVVARQKARSIATALKFDPQDQTRIATSVSELARNAFQYAGGGSAEFQVQTEGEKMLVITLRDSGRGIPNLQEILDGKYSSRTGMGLGLIGAKRLMDSFHIESAPDKGTRVILGKLIPRRSSALDPKEILKAAREIERESQGPYEEIKQQNRELLSAMQELRSRQEELAQRNRELDETNRVVVALYAELNEKADFLQRASELKSHFLSNMSHEFRTPLNSIIGLSQILMDRLDGDLSAEQEKQVRFIRGSAQGVMELVNDLLDLAKVEAGKMAIRPAVFDVTSLFAVLRGMLRPLLTQNSSVNLVFEDPVGIPEIYSDEAKVSQILRNFISNALKFTERGEIRVSVRRGHGNTVLFSVADTGIGIAPEDQERIFQEWTQIEGRAQRNVKGTGLGLPLSRKFAQMLGGDVYVESQLGIGSTFYASIPISFNGQTEVIYDIDQQQTDIGTGTLPILIVEDNQQELLIYERCLQNTRFKIVRAKNLKEARRALRSIRPLAIVLDVLLQGEHSWELLQDLKRDLSTANIPILMVTVVENRDKALALGATAFHSKPVDRSWLLMQLSTFANSSRGKQLLLIDDDPVSRYLVKTILASSDVRVLEATGGSDGLRKASEEEPDAVILDLGMPDLSGFEVLSKLKSNPMTNAIPVIIHTSRVLGSQELEMLRDAVAIVSKESESREGIVSNFESAFAKAGLPITIRPKQPKEINNG